MPDAALQVNGRLIRAVIFDYGEVLSFPPPPETIAAMAGLLRVTSEEFRESYYAERLPYDRGELTPEQYWQAVAGRAGTQLTPENIEWLRDTDVEMWSRVNPKMLEWAAQLRKKGMHTAVLSNMHADMAESVRGAFPWIPDFRCFVISAEVRSAKPEPQIFHHCLDCLTVPANSVLFIDDKLRNTRSAEQLGMTALCANSPESIRQQLYEAGWNGPLPE